MTASEGVPRFRTVDVVVPKGGRLIPREVRAHLVVSEDAEIITEHPLVFPGIGQDGRIPRRIASLIAAIDVADALPYWQVPPEQGSLEALAIAYPLAAVHAWQESHDSAALPQVVGESLAALGVALADAEDPDSIGDIAYIRPLGFTAEVFGTTAHGRLLALGRRAFTSLSQWDQNPLQDRWNLYSAGRIVRHMGGRALRQIQA